MDFWPIRSHLTLRLKTAKISSEIFAIFMSTNDRSSVQALEIIRYVDANFDMKNTAGTALEAIAAPRTARRSMTKLPPSSGHAGQGAGATWWPCFCKTLRQGCVNLEK